MSKNARKEGRSEALAWAADKFEESWQYANQNLHTNWEENWKLYNNKRIRRKHDGVVDTFVPMTNSSVNTLMAALYNNTPRFIFVPDTPDQNQDTEILSEIMDDFSMKDGWAQKNLENGTNTSVTGNGPVYYEWEEDRITKEVIPVRDFICDPTATSWRDWQYAGRRYFATKEKLKEQTVLDPRTGKIVQRYKNLEKLEGMDGNGGYMSDKEIKDAALGQSSLGMKGRVEVIEIWSNKRVVTLAGRSVVVEDIENPHYRQEKLVYEQRKSDWDIQRQMTLATEGVDIGEFGEEFRGRGMIPFALGRGYIDSSMIYGTSDVDIIKEQQELLNDLKELNIEAILYQLYPERRVDPQFVAMVDNLDPKPGKVYPFPAGAMDWNTPPSVPSNAFNEIATTKAEMRESIAVDNIVKGVTSATSQTATEIKAQLGQASQRIEMKAKNLENDFFLQEGRICLQLIKLYMREKTMVRVMKNAGVQWQEYDPSAFLGEYTPMVKLDLTKELEKAKTQDAYRQAYEIVIADPTNNLEEAKRIMYPKMMPDLSKEEIEAIVTPAAPPPPEQGQPPMEEMPMEGVPPGMGEIPMEQPIEEAI